MTGSSVGRTGSTCRQPTITNRIVAPAGVKIVAGVGAAPDDHLAASPDCSVTRPSGRCIGGGHNCPSVGARIVLSAGVPDAAGVSATPDDHFTAGPYHSVRIAPIRRAGCGSPGITIAIAADYFGKLILTTRQRPGCRNLVFCLDPR